MNIWFVLAAVAALFTALVHTFVGRKFVVRPLLASKELHQISLFTNYYCWHVATIILFSVSGMFFYVTAFPEAWEIAWLATAYATVFVAWSVAMILWKKLSFKKFPQWALILPIAVFGLAGLLT